MAFCRFIKNCIVSLIKFYRKEPNPDQPFQIVVFPDTDFINQVMVLTPPLATPDQGGGIQQNPLGRCIHCGQPPHLLWKVCGEKKKIKYH